MFVAVGGRGRYKNNQQTQSEYSLEQVSRAVQEGGGS